MSDSIGAPTLHQPLRRSGTFGRTPFAIRLAIVSVLGLAIRVAQVTWASGGQRLRGDEFYYYWQAAYNAKGYWFTQPYSLLSGVPRPGADHPPGFVLFLTFLHWVRIETATQQLYAIAVMGSCTTIVAGLVMRKVVGSRSGIIGATIVAIYPAIWMNDGRIMSETMYLFCFCLALLAFFSFRASGTWRWLVTMSLALAVASSARPEAILLFPAVALPAIVAVNRGRSRRRSIAMAASALLFPVALFTPWSIYNSRRFHQPVIMSTGAGQTFVQGNCTLTYYKAASLGVNQFRCMQKENFTSAEMQNAALRDVAYRHQALTFVKGHLRRLPVVMLAREGRTFNFWYIDQQVRVDSMIEDRGSIRFVRYVQWSWWLVALLAVPGIVIWRRQRYQLYPFMAQFGLTVLVVGFTFGSTRYRVGVDLCAALLAATTIEFALRYLVTRRRVNRADRRLDRGAVAGVRPPRPTP